MLRIVQVSDTHLSPDAPYADDNWAAVVAHVAAADVDLVIHTGDITLDGARHAGELAHARERLELLAVPWLAIPGNHDIGDEIDPTLPLTPERLRRYEEQFGTGSWVRVLDEWRLVGFDIQTLMGADPAAAELAGWLHDVLAGDRPTALFLHRPLWPWDAGEVDQPERYVAGPARALLDELVGAGGVRLVASGHVHQWRERDFAGVRHVWAPSSWAMLPDRIQPVIGEKVVGVVEHVLGDDGAVGSRLVQPAGIAQVTGGDDFPSPY